MFNSVAAFIFFVSAINLSFSAPLVYEGIPLKDRLKIAKAAESFIKEVEASLNHSIDEVIEANKNALSLDVKKIDANSEATEVVYVIAKNAEDAEHGKDSYLFAPLAIPETVKEDTQGIEDAFIEIALPAEDGTDAVSQSAGTDAVTQTEGHPAPAAAAADAAAAAPAPTVDVLKRFTRTDLPPSVPDDVRKSFEAIQQALVYPSGFLKDGDEETIPIDLILGLFKPVEKKDFEEKIDVKDGGGEAEETQDAAAVEGETQGAAAAVEGETQGAEGDAKPVGGVEADGVKAGIEEQKIVKQNDEM